MNFISFEFPIFLALIFALYWAIPAGYRHARNSLILVASYVFYGWWDVRFLSLIIISSVVDYFAGRLIANTQSQGARKAFLAVSVLTNLSILGFFKYFNFFLSSMQDLLSGWGLEAGWSLNVILPVGISFYTFQTMSYTIDVYRGQATAERDPIAFFAFVSFFPQLVAGPIERAKNLLPQFATARVFDPELAREGLRMILWGTFMKVVVADSCARFADPAFNQTESLPGSMLLIGLVCFAVQIYGDFSGYSLIARGTARLFGFELMQNFACPYFAQSIGEFWKRWHISLSTWFRDYVYIPLGGNRRGRWRQARNILITFIVSGLWHGANWTFLFWGMLHGLAYLPTMFRGKREASQQPLIAICRVGMTFSLVLISWVFFRSASLPEAWIFLQRLFSPSLLYPPSSMSAIGQVFLLGPQFMLMGFALLAEWRQRRYDHPLNLQRWPLVCRWLVYYGLILFILGNYEDNRLFIYFQF